MSSPTAVAASSPMLMTGSAPSCLPGLHLGWGRIDGDKVLGVNRCAVVIAAGPIDPAATTMTV
ncbi:hypothetical protein [Nonomuraea sp. NPDC049480]|uniref:hypothetical protein n=1 Tax=Nonomuraea sp. NPDC049480 TaxID=3364353 RepID=UPI0037B2C24D